ncbi:DUF6503 family protein [Croceitalea marina]|uniref:DUF6503 family protein n=1 Tax=Croceitalea marina TaxID=1775166 RepID=A0ABW5MZA8_9FLAO
MRHLKFLSAYFFIMTMFCCNVTKLDSKNSIYILNQVKEKYDVSGNWKNSEIKIHIQEPRVGNPKRYTRLVFNNTSGYFEMQRTKDIGAIKRIININGESKIFVDGKSVLSNEIKEKYALNKQKTEEHKNFYKILYGVPMSLTNELWNTIEPAQSGEYQGKEVYRIDLVLKENVISKNWTLIISKEMDKLLAIEFNHPEDGADGGEILRFFGEYEFNGVKIPRIRNWYSQSQNEYLGSDVIIEKLK